jgi:hypothetical protein
MNKIDIIELFELKDKINYIKHRHSKDQFDNRRK